MSFFGIMTPISACLMQVRRDPECQFVHNSNFGFVLVDREKLLQAVKIEQEKGSITPLLVMDENYYKDRGCMAAYLAKNKEHTEFYTDDICDIIFNVVEGDMVKSLQTQQVTRKFFLLVV